MIVYTMHGIYNAWYMQCMVYTVHGIFNACYIPCYTPCIVYTIHGVYHGINSKIELLAILRTHNNIAKLINIVFLIYP